jgi:uncharacterized membrane protein
MKHFHPRSVAKAVTWRFFAGIDTFLLTLLLTGKIGIAGSVMGAEVFTKIGIYYLHERLWRIPLLTHMFHEDR